MSRKVSTPLAVVVIVVVVLVVIYFIARSSKPRTMTPGAGPGVSGPEAVKQMMQQGGQVPGAPPPAPRGAGGPGAGGAAPVGGPTPPAAPAAPGGGG